LQSVHSPKFKHKSSSDKIIFDFAMLQTF